jgi:hypothetical protein
MRQAVSVDPGALHQAASPRRQKSTCAIRRSARTRAAPAPRATESRSRNSSVVQVDDAPGGAFNFWHRLGSSGGPPAVRVAPVLSEAQLAYRRGGDDGADASAALRAGCVSAVPPRRTIEAGQPRRRRRRRRRVRSGRDRCRDSASARLRLTSGPRSRSTQATFSASGPDLVIRPGERPWTAIVFDVRGAQCRRPARLAGSSGGSVAAQLQLGVVDRGQAGEGQGGEHEPEVAQGDVVEAGVGE